MRILLAEDERELSQALAVLLRHERYSVDVVDNGEDALACLESGQYDGAILDIMMPKMDGLTVLKTIRARKFAIPVLLLTAKSQVDDRVEGLDCGADDYLTKPFSMKELLARIRAMLRRRDMAEEGSLTFQNLTLEYATFSLTTPSGSIRLANKEFQMMEMLMSQPGTVIPTARFVEKIWGYDCDAQLHVVWVGISNLRKKLTSLDAHVRITALRGRGYALEELHD